MKANTTPSRASIHIPGSAFTAQQRAHTRAAAARFAAELLTILISLCGLALAAICTVMLLIAI